MDRPRMVREVQIKIGLMIAAALLCLGHSSAFAQESKAAVGLLVGLSVPDANNANPIHLDGVTGMAAYSPTFQFGGYYLVPGTTEGKDGRKFRYSMHGLQAAYIPAGTSGAGGTTFFGFRLGMSKVETDQNSTKLMFSPYHYGIFAGHDYALWAWLSFGFEGSFYRFHASQTTVNNVTYNEDMFNVISFMVSLKISL